MRKYIVHCYDMADGKYRLAHHECLSTKDEHIFASFAARVKAGGMIGIVPLRITRTEYEHDTRK